MRAVTQKIETEKQKLDIYKDISRNKLSAAKELVESLNQRMKAAELQLGRARSLRDKQAVSDAIVDSNVVVGTPEQCAETIRDILDLGYDGVSMTVYLHRDKIRFWREFSSEVMPLVAA